MSSLPRDFRPIVNDTVGELLLMPVVASPRVSSNVQSGMSSSVGNDSTIAIANQRDRLRYGTCSRKRPASGVLGMFAVSGVQRDAKRLERIPIACTPIRSRAFRRFQRRQRRLIQIREKGGRAEECNTLRDGDHLYSAKSSATAANCSSAACRSSTISAARTSGSGRLAVSSNDSSRSQKMSRLTLSRAISSS